MRLRRVEGSQVGGHAGRHLAVPKRRFGECGRPFGDSVVNGALLMVVYQAVWIGTEAREGRSRS